MSDLLPAVIVDREPATPGLVAIDRLHSRISPSSIERCINCPASVFLSGRVQRAAPGIDALTGTAAHRVFEICLTEDLDTFELGDLRSVMIDGQDIPVDDGMLDTVQVAVDAVRELLAGRPYEVEKTLHLDFAEFYLGEPIWGHADVITTDAPRVVVDLKNGFNYVGADSLQLGTYLLMPTIVDNPGLEGEGLAGTTVIIQPNARAEPVRRHDWSWQDLRNLRDRIIDMLRQVKRQDMTYQFGDWCRYCPAAGICPHLHAIALDPALTQISPSPESVASGAISRARLEDLIDRAGVLEHFLKQLYATAEDYLIHGGKLRNQKLVRKRTNRHWKATSETEVADELKALGLEDPWTRKIISPTQAEKALPKGKRATLAELVEQPIGELTMVPKDDPKPEIETGATLRAAVMSTKARGFLSAVPAPGLVPGHVEPGK